MKPVFMVDDLGGIVYVEKNMLHLCYFAGDKLEIEIDTQKLLALLKSRSNEQWWTKEFAIEPMVRDAKDNALLVIIRYIFDEHCDDKAVVWRSDLVEVLDMVEIPA